MWTNLTEPRVRVSEYNIKVATIEFKSQPPYIPKCESDSDVRLFPSLGQNVIPSLPPVCRQNSPSHRSRSLSLAPAAAFFILFILLKQS